MRQVLAISASFFFGVVLMILTSKPTLTRLASIDEQNQELNLMFSTDYKTLAKAFKRQADSLEMYKSWLRNLKNCETKTD